MHFLAAQIKMARDDEAVAGVVAAAATDQHFAADAQAAQQIGAAAPGVFHQDERRESVFFESEAIDRPHLAFINAVATSTFETLDMVAQVASYVPTVAYPVNDNGFGFALQTVAGSIESTAKAPITTPLSSSAPRPRLASCQLSPPSVLLYTEFQ